MSEVSITTEGPRVGRGVFAQKGMQPPLNKLFALLRDIWRTQNPGHQYKDLAQKLGVSHQYFAQWATGTDKRKPPWHVVMWLCAETGYAVYGTAGGWKLIPLAPPES